MGVFPFKPFGDIIMRTGKDIKVDEGHLQIGGDAVDASAAELDILDGATLDTAELNKLDGVLSTQAEIDAAAHDLPFDFTITPAAGAANVCEVTIQAADADGAAIAHVVELAVWLSDAASGAGFTAHAADTLAVKAASGQLVHALEANKALQIQTLADGSAVIQITDTHKTLYKVCVQSPNDETPTVATLVAENYGA